MRAKKHLGQHFLNDVFVLSEIIYNVQPKRDQSFVEIGPGYGALTKMLAPMLKSLSVIEIDSDCMGELEKLSNLVVYNQDVLKFNWHNIAANTRVVGNLPYNIATEIFFICLEASNVSDMHFMMQKEVANRLIATHNSKSYGKLSVMMQAQAEIELLFDIPPEAFSPPPKVMSSFCKITPKSEKMTIAQLRLLDKIVSAAFSRRRKQCHHNLKIWCSKSDLEGFGIDPSLRAENISVAQYINMAKHLH